MSAEHTVAEPGSAAPTGEALDYWAGRARERGREAAINLDHPSGSLDAVSAAHLGIIEPALRRLLRGHERTLLDLGCGSARLTGPLARVLGPGGRAIGVDPVAAMLELAEEHDDVELRLMRGGALPVADDEADVVVTCTVLGGVLEAGALAATAAEVRRVLAPGGVLLLCESVSDRPHDGHWLARSADEYAEAFGWADLVVAGRLDDGGDPLTVLAGRAPG